MYYVLFHDTNGAVTWNFLILHLVNEVSYFTQKLSYQLVKPTILHLPVRRPNRPIHIKKIFKPRSAMMNDISDIAIITGSVLALRRMWWPLKGPLGFSGDL
jgi:hypothetical protein